VCDVNPSGIVHPHSTPTAFCNSVCVRKMAVQSGCSDSDKPTCIVSGSGSGGKTSKKI
jgi:hypothetical protein